MKNDQKNPIYPSVLVSCIFKQANLMFRAELDKALFKTTNEFGVELWFKMAQTHLVVVALAQHTHIAMSCACIILLHIAMYWLCYRCNLRGRFYSRGYSRVSSWRAVPLDHSVRQGKPPCSFRYNPTLSLLLSFIALGQQRFICYLLR